MHYLKVLVIFVGTLAGISYARAETEAYSTIYVADERRDETSWNLSVGGTYDVSNPYLSTFGAEVLVLYRVVPFFLIGPQVNAFYSQKNSLTDAMETFFNQNHISQVITRPLTSEYLVFELRPLGGRLNLFSASSIRFDFIIDLGAGLSQTQPTSNPWAGMWSVRTAFGLGRRFDTHIGLKQEVDSIFTSTAATRTQIVAGLSLRLG